MWATLISSFDLYHCSKAIYTGFRVMEIRRVKVILTYILDIDPIVAGNRKLI